ncbi:D-alanine--D-alanine ligase family protein [Alloscardovia sp. HMSC034E08]|uniref:D-alanine--D-alanine ligase family protein n=1 Tax=Alloscardovia sp. HMSC034E08 TaxID=1739413 RepID=UPI0008ACD660|nr:D-alanine--D-alanine ligase [Alloscardovia sp. HMSC034E08]OFQ99312.1 D-alanine--D-alanine ligase [Alloscardovia sp. HMSC034E08]
MTSRVAILCGGLSHERDISLSSSHRVAGFLEDAGRWDVDIHDVDTSLIDYLLDPSTRPDVVWPLLHGSYGEDGSLRDILEMLDLPYLGSRAKASMLAWSKPIAKNIVRKIGGINTPHSVTLPQEIFRELGVKSIINLIVSSIGMPVIVKPHMGGSALGCTVVREPESLPQALVDCFAYDQTALIERYVEGTEVSVSILDTGNEIIALPPMEISTPSGVYDYSERYTPGATEFIIPARVDDDVLTRVKEDALTAFQVLGMRDITRVDFIVDANGIPQFLEANVTPGMTDVSILPRQAVAAGYGLSDLYSRMLDAVISQKRNVPHADISL